MESKPIKRTSEIMPLSREHHFSLLFSWKINQGLKSNIPAERIIRYVTYFWENNLRLHFEQEEVVLFNPFRDDPLVVQALEEHSLARNLIHSLIERQGSDLEQRQKLKQLSELITAHVRTEERTIFPELENRMSEEELNKAASLLHHLQLEPLQDDYEDEFWVNTNVES